MLCYTNHPKCDNKALCVAVSVTYTRVKQQSRAGLDIALAGGNPVRIITFTVCKDLRKQTTLSPSEGRDCVCASSARGKYSNSHSLLNEHGSLAENTLTYAQRCFFFCLRLQFSLLFIPQLLLLPSVVLSA